MSDAAWPEGSVSLFSGALSERTLAAAVAESDAMAACAPNFWVPREAIEAATAPRCLAEQVVYELYDRVMRERLPEDWLGAEWWCQVYRTPGRGLAFHFDKCEAEMAASGVMHNPILSSVLYLNSAEECFSPPLGATFVMEQCFDAEKRCGVPDPSRRDVLAWPSPNTLLVFDGRLAHGVLDSDSRVVRRSMLVNWWRRQPRNVVRATASEYTTTRALSPALSPDVSTPVVLPSHAACSAVHIPVLTLTAARDCVDGPAPLSQVLESRGCVAGATRAVALHHPDTVIWQVEAGETEETEAEAAPEAGYTPLVAALIPDALAVVDSEDAGSDDGSAENED